MLENAKLKLKDSKITLSVSIFSWQMLTFDVYFSRYYILIYAKLICAYSLLLNVCFRHFYHVYERYKAMFKD